MQQLLEAQLQLKQQGDLPAASQTRMDHMEKRMMDASENSVQLRVQLGALQAHVDAAERLFMFQPKADLEMFRELISQQERALVGRIESPRRAISQLAARVFEARTRASGPGFLGAQADRQAELRHLDALSEQLAKLASDE